MKKTLTLLAAILILVTLGYPATLRQEAENAVYSINALQNLPWKAKVPESTDLFESLGFETWEQVSSQVNKYRELPKEQIDSFYQSASDGSRLTYTENSLYASMIIWFYDALRDGTVFPKDFIQKHTPVRNQSFYGSCWAFATVGSLESALLVQEDELAGSSVIPQRFSTDLAAYNQDSRYDFSEQFTAYHNIDWDMYLTWWYGLNPNNESILQESNYDAGGNSVFGNYNLIRFGVPEEADFPYDLNSFTGYFRWNPQNDNWQNKIRKTAKFIQLLSAYYSKLDGISYEDYIKSIKSLIMHFGSLAVSFKTPASYSYYSEGIYIPLETDYYGGGHAVTMVGWVSGETLQRLGVLEEASITYTDHLSPAEEKQYSTDLFWVIKNSWGNEWGMDGYYLVPALSKKQWDQGAVSNWLFEYNAMRVPVINETIDTSLADFNNDCNVDEADFNLLVENIEEGEAAYELRFDISNPADGIINANDLAVFMYLWNLAND